MTAVEHIVEAGIEPPPRRRPRRAISRVIALMVGA